MRTAFTTLFLLAHTLLLAQPADTTHLYPIFKNGLYGYINQYGEVKIRLQFKNAAQFSEGLAAVRVNGFYGFIDYTGKIIIPAKYDYAMNFTNGCAIVCINRKPYLIDGKAEKLFNHNYTGISACGSAALFKVFTSSHKAGFINRYGKLIIDTVFSSTGWFSNGLCTVDALKKNKKGGNTEIGVIDSLGHFVVKYGRFSRIGDFANGFAKVTTSTKNRDDEKEGFINRAGKLVFTLPGNIDMEGDKHYFKDNVSAVDVDIVKRDTVKMWSSDRRYTCAGLIDTTGKLVFVNNDFDAITPFENNIAFAKKTKGKYCLINREGTIISTREFDDVYKEGFIGGICIGKYKNTLGIIKPDGDFIGQPAIQNFDFRNINLAGNTAYITQNIEDDSDNEYQAWAIWDLASNTMITDSCTNTNFTDINKEPVLIAKNGLFEYINSTGLVLWSCNNNETSVKNMDIDYMNRGYFYASSPDIENLREYGGWGSSGNLSKNGQATGYKTLSVKIDTSKLKIFGGQYEAYGLSLKNNAADTMFFEAQDSRLYMKTQAKDADGVWRDIEYLPNSWCGNSYHKLFLATNQYWDFLMPKYYGELKTKLRIVVEYKKYADQKKPDLLFSNEINGFINPGQFWRKLQYYPTGIMDSYNE